MNLYESSLGAIDIVYVPEFTFSNESSDGEVKRLNDNDLFD